MGTPYALGVPRPAGTPTVGQVPVVTTADPLAMGWGSGSGFSLVKGKAGDQLLTPGTQVSGGGYAMTLNREVAIPMMIPAGRSLASIGIHVITAGAAGSTIRVGIRDDDNAYPSTLIADLGTVDSSATGLKTVVANYTPSDYTKLVWLTVAAQGGTAPVIYALIGVPIFFQNSQGGFPTGIPRSNTDSISGALPASSFLSRGLTTGTSGGCNFWFTLG